MNIFNRLVMCMDTVAVLPHAHIDNLHTHTMDKFTVDRIRIIHIEIIILCHADSASPSSLDRDSRRGAIHTQSLPALSVLCCT